MGKQTIPVVDLVEANDANILFGTDKTRYVVPVYQRAFAWGQGGDGKKQDEIVQLMEDVLSSKGSYYLGSLVVSRCLPGQYEDRYDYEVIDGQQRLTALYLIFACIGFKVNRGSMGYACRPASMDLLEGLAAGNAFSHLPPHTPADEDEDEDEAWGIRVGIRTIHKYLSKRHGVTNIEKAKEELRSKFKNVKMFRIEVPEKTDLNRYFEIMNTRGEQLEHQDVVKADLLSRLDDDAQRGIFATVWDACSDMDGYVQMHFSGDHMKKGQESLREMAFGDKWSAAPTLERLDGVAHGVSESARGFDDIVDHDVDGDELDKDGETYRNARFEGIIGYPQLLLHVLKVFNRVSGENVELPEQTDAAKLRDEFMTVFKDADAAKVMRFAECLLKCRYYFDKCIIKREYVGKKDEGAWSLKELVKSDGKKESAYYRDTRNNGDAYARHAELLMIESCLRVSYTNPKIMHWITNVLYWLYVNGENDLDGLLEYACGLARENVRKFLADGDYNLGVQTHNVVLNYLDYLLWKQKGAFEKNPLYAVWMTNPFAFEFRDSVEHWYPQHPDRDAEGCPEWSEVDATHGVVDRFGNLALLQSNINAHFSNQPPKGKCSYGDSIKNGSMKLRIMAALTTACKENEDWRSTVCEKHEKEMLSILREDCNLHQ